MRRSRRKKLTNEKIDEAWEATQDLLCCDFNRSGWPPPPMRPLLPQDIYKFLRKQFGQQAADYIVKNSKAFIFH